MRCPGASLYRRSEFNIDHWTDHDGKNEINNSFGFHEEAVVLYITENITWTDGNVAVLTKAYKKIKKVSRLP